MPRDARVRWPPTVGNAVPPYGRQNRRDMGRCWRREGRQSSRSASGPRCRPKTPNTNPKTIDPTPPNPKAKHQTASGRRIEVAFRTGIYVVSLSLLRARPVVSPSPLRQRWRSAFGSRCRPKTPTPQILDPNPKTQKPSTKQPHPAPNSLWKEDFFHLA